MNDSNQELFDLLSKTAFVPELKATDKKGVLAELADFVAAEGLVPADQREEVFAALMDREGKMSTGMQYGVAIPHAKTDLVPSMVTAIALAPAGIPFDTLDGEPANTFVVTLSPSSDANSHIRFLALVTRQLANRRVRERVLAAKTKGDLLAAFAPEA